MLRARATRSPRTPGTLIFFFCNSPIASRLPRHSGQGVKRRVRTASSTSMEGGILGICRRCAASRGRPRPAAARRPGPLARASAGWEPTCPRAPVPRLPHARQPPRSTSRPPAASTHAARQQPPALRDRAHPPRGRASLVCRPLTRPSARRQAPQKVPAAEAERKGAALGQGQGGVLVQVLQHRLLRRRAQAPLQTLRPRLLRVTRPCTRLRCCRDRPARAHPRQALSRLPRLSASALSPLRPCLPVESRHCCSNKRTLIKYGYLKPVRLCNKCNASCFKADLLLNAVCASRGVRRRARTAPPHRSRFSTRSEWARL